MMNIENAAYLVSKLMCKAYKLRNRQDYPCISDDPCFAVNRACNRELDTLTDIDRQQAVKGFNRAFAELYIARTNRQGLH